MTLNEFKQAILSEAEVSTADEFRSISNEYNDFWKDLNRIVLRNFDPEKIPQDPDAKVYLSADQISVFRIIVMRLKFFGTR